MMEDFNTKGTAIYRTLSGSEFSLASTSNRFLAKLIDIAILLGILVVSSIFIVVGKFLVYTVAYIGGISLLIFQAYLLTVYGQTVGKRIMKVRIISCSDGRNGGLVPNFLLRTLISGMFCLIPLYWFIDSLFILAEGRRCLHDKLAGTIVIEEG